MTFGEILTVGGIVLIAAGVLTLLIGGIVLAGKKKRLKDKLYDRYGL